MCSLFFLAMKHHKIRKKWRAINTHNDTYSQNYFNPNIVSVGNYSYGGITVFCDEDDKHLYIGSFCSIARNVIFLLGHEHSVDRISTFPFKTKIIHECLSEATSKGDIIVDDDVWIGYNSTILSGVHIGQGAVVGTNAVVTSDVPPYAIVGGVPARVIKYRFSDSVINFLLTLDYEFLTEELIKLHIDIFYKPIEEMDIEEIESLFSWFPKKNVNSHFRFD